VTFLYCFSYKILKRGSNINCGSLGLNLKNGQWHRFSTGQGGDIFKLVAEAGYSKRDALEIVAGYAGFAKGTMSGVQGIGHNITPTNEAPKSVEPRDEWLSYAKVPANASAFNSEHHIGYMLKENMLEGIYEYKNNKGELLGYTVRLKSLVEGTKQVLPVSYCYNEALSQSSDKWRFKGFSDEGNKPIYGAHKIEQDRKPIFIVEGEKTADIAQKLLTEYSVLSWMGGSNGADKADWSKLQDREVVIWPDNDAPGLKAAEQIASRINFANGFKGLVSVVNPAQLEFNGKQHSDLFAKGWDLGDKLPEGVTHENIKEVISNIRVEAMSLEKTHVSEEKLTNEIQSGISKNREDVIREGVIKNNAINILWQNKAAGNIGLNTETIAEQAKVFTEHQERISSPETISYVKYALARGVLDQPHEFLNIEHGLVRDALVQVSLNREKGGNASDILDKEQHEHKQASDEVKNMITGLQDEYTARIRSVHFDSKISDKYIKSFSANPDKQELFKILSRDVAFIHRESLQAPLTNVHQDRICKTVQECITECTSTTTLGNSNVSHSSKLDILDKLGIAEDVHSKVSSKDWWKELNNDHMAASMIASNKHDQILDKFINANTDIIDDIKKLDPHYGVSNLKTQLMTLSDNDRYKALDKELFNVFKSVVLPELAKIGLMKSEANSPDKVIETFKAEKDYCMKTYNAHWRLCNQLEREEKNDHITKINALHKFNEGLMDDLTKDVKTIAKSKIWTEDRLMDTLKNNQSYSTISKTVFSGCQEHFIKEVNHDIRTFKVSNSVIRDEHKYESLKDYLGHRIHDQSTGRYLVNTSVEKHYNELVKHDQHIEQEKALMKEMSMGMTMR